MLAKLQFTADDLHSRGIGTDYNQAHLYSVKLNQLLDDKLANYPLIGHTCRSNYGCAHEEGLGIWAPLKDHSTHAGIVINVHPYFISKERAWKKPLVR